MSRRTKSEQLANRRFLWRSRLMLTMFFAIAVALTARAIDLQLLDDGFLADQADIRHIRTEKIVAHRGPITDRHGEPLAVSTPVDSLWVNPQELARAPQRLDELADAVGRDPGKLRERISRSQDREFLYLKRHMNPGDARAVLARDIPGVHAVREYRRYYPAGEVTGHLLGFTSIDDVGQEGLELAFDSWLAGESGLKRVIKDRLGRTVEDLEGVRPARPGRTLTTSMDLRVQYLAYRELKAAINRNNATSGSVVVLDVATGEVLAMVNQPTYNPNDRSQLSVSRYRNRAVTDMFEPGSSFKPFVIAAALEDGRYTPTTVVDTSPGYLPTGNWTVADARELGTIDVTAVLTQSINIGAIRIALSLEPEQLWGTLDAFGYGRLSASGFPGESAGLLSHYAHWRKVGQATLAYGYGLSVTPLQLVQAYAAIASGGLFRSISMTRLTRPATEVRVVSQRTAASLTRMLETVISPVGTGMRADISGYRVAGKTGTAKMYSAGGYSEDRYVAVFAGLAPASAPRLAAVVVISDPGGREYYGGEIAAPVFSQIMGGSLRLLGVPPDDIRQPTDGLMQAAAP
ncbi:MAG: penicillin-binding transpeptidase domain-containing protein [Gammaproteobacteria bacterium]